MLTVAGLFILTTIAALDAQAAPLALEPSTNEEVWIKVDAPVVIDWYEDSCRYDHTEYRTFKDYENCIFKSLAQADNAQSRKWGLSDRVI